LNTRKRMTNILIVLVAVAAFGYILADEPAMASSFKMDGNSSSTNCNTNQYGTVTCVTVTSASASAKDTESSSVSAVSSSKTGLVYLLEEHLVGTPKPSAPHCTWWKEGWNSGYGANGQLFWFVDHNLHVCPDSHSPTGWVKVGGGMTGADCGNIVRPMGSPPKKNVVASSKVRFVANFTWNAAIKIKSVSMAKVSVSVNVHNADYSCTASASASGSATATATATATASASSKVKAVTTAKGQAVKITQSLNQSGSAEAEGTATTQATATASAKATCSNSTTTTTTLQTTTTTTAPTTTTTTVPKSVPPVVTNVTQPQEADINGTQLICADVYAPSGDSVTITFNAVFGNFSGSTESNPNGAANSYCNTYTAPSEVPTTAPSSSAPVGDDMVTVFVYDKTTGLSATSNPVYFPIVNPGTFQ